VEVMALPSASETQSQPLSVIPQPNATEERDRDEEVILRYLPRIVELILRLLNTRH
jgi:hypothetical protein